MSDHRHVADVSPLVHDCTDLCVRGRIVNVATKNTCLIRKIHKLHSYNEATIHTTMALLSTSNLLLKVVLGGDSTKDKFLCTVFHKTILQYNAAIIHTTTYLVYCKVHLSSVCVCVCVCVQKNEMYFHFKYL